MKIKSFEHACEVLKRDPEKLPVVNGLPKKHAQYIIDNYKLVTIVEATNNDPKFPNWNDSNQYKYSPWAWVKASDKQPAGFGFSDSDFDLWYAVTYVGSRLCFKDRGEAEYTFKKFKKLYLSVLLIQ